MNNLLIIGDSFAADWTVKYQLLGWPNLLAQSYKVTNIAQAGVSEYKILKQIQSVDMSMYDCVIVSHTSANRIATRKHPIHCNDKLHHSADLIFTDIEYHASRLKNIFNNSLRTAKNFFTYHYDQEYQDTVYSLMRKEVNEIIGSTPCIVVSNLIIDDKFITEKHYINIYKIQQEHPGLANHLDEAGNQMVFEQLTEKINEVSNSHSSRN